MIEPSLRPKLPSVTLVAVTSVALGATVAALRASIRQAEFANVLLLSHEQPGQLDAAIEWRRIHRLRSRADYSKFMLRDLAGHISSEHALCVQWDGFVVNGAAWEPEFLHYDYIGAVWPHFRDNYNVGNGGFSLRSKKLLEACRELPATGPGLEDVLISRVHRPQLERSGLRFAPDDVARRFSYERTAPTGAEFGFHGAFNLVRYLSPADAARLFRSLDPGILAANERWELLRWALARGQLTLAGTMFARILRAPFLSRR